MNKKLIRLTESDLHRIVKESVGKILKEIDSNNSDAQNNGLTSTSNKPKRRRSLSQKELSNYINRNLEKFRNCNKDKINQILYPEHTDKYAKDQLSNKLIGF